MKVGPDVLTLEEYFFDGWKKRLKFTKLTVMFAAHVIGVYITNQNAWNLWWLFMNADLISPDGTD